MTAAKFLVLYITTLLFINGNNCHIMFHFPDPIHYVDSCRTAGNWTVTGNVTLKSNDLDFFSPNLIIRASSDLCTINVYTCGQNTQHSNVTSPVKCSCKARPGGVYTVSVTGPLNAGQSGQMLQVVVPTRNVFSQVTTQANIGVIPAVDHTNLTLTYQVNDAQFQDLLSSQNVSAACENACENEYTDIKVCASNLRPGSSLTIATSEQKTIANGLCVHLAEKFSFDRVDEHKVVVTLDDNVGCSVKDVRVFYVHEKNCKTTTVPTKAALATCASLPSSRPRQLATLPSGASVLCDTVTDGGGWIVFQRRASGSVDFYRNWADYTAGFGDLSPTGNFWLGLEEIHGLCGSSSDNCELRIDMKYNNANYYAKYGSFYISDKSDNYRLHISSYSGDAGDALLNYDGNTANGMQFTTFDRDNDKYSGGNNCASFEHGAWWYNSCYGANLNGKWDSSRLADHMIWVTLEPGNGVVRFSEMKLRLIN